MKSDLLRGGRRATRRVRTMANYTLEKDSRFVGVKGPVLVCVMDGVGRGSGGEGDAVALARTPTLDFLERSTPHALLAAHGTAVGMPSDGDMGNSEVGHNALGAGRVFDQGAKLVENAIRSGSLFEGDTWQALVRGCRERGTTLHFLGLLSDGNVHSHIEHLLAMLRRADSEDVRSVRVHILLDGRDVSETSALTYVEMLEKTLAEISQKSERDYRVASGGGRMKITMDRYGADWGMVERGYLVHVLGDGRGFPSAEKAIETFREETPGIIDQDLPPFVVTADGKPVGAMADGDGVILFNFRGDRAIEISQALSDESFDHFDRRTRPKVHFAGMMEYDGDLKVPNEYLVPPPVIEGALGLYLAHTGVSQLAISETQKYGHVTYFWNGNRSGMFDDKLEHYVEIPSDRVPFEERPWMKAAEITDSLIEHLQKGTFRHGRVNYANGDMVGHTGKLEAAIAAVNVVDLQLARLLPVINRLEGALIVTADHGNADEMFELGKDGAPKVDSKGVRKAKTSHTLNRVPCYIYAPSVSFELDASVERPGLANVAATSVQLLGLRPPADYAQGLLKA